MLAQVDAASTVDGSATRAARNFRSPRWSEAIRARFGGQPITFTSDEGFAVGRFLRALNVALTLDIAKQRLRAAQTLFARRRRSLFIAAQVI
jgi:hypothetical protein